MDLIKEAKVLLEYLEPSTETHVNLIKILNQYVELAEKEEFRKDYKIVSIQYERI